MRKTDINKYVGSKNSKNNGTATTGKLFRKTIGKFFLTLLTIIFITGVIVFVSLISFIMSIKNEAIDYDLHKLQLNYTSFIYVNGPNDDSAHPVKYQSLYSNENRIWVDYDKIPKYMKDAIVSIEDKRYWEHNGVDWKRTSGAVVTLFSKGSSYGGSTITQQLIKNITGDNDVSITRKVKEIFRALTLEEKYTKEEILGAYLNVVNFGSGTNGVQAAANLYFGKNIQDCDIAECASIAGITQNPSKYSPLAHADLNKERQQTVLTEMKNQGKITEDEYKTAMAKSENMKFVGKRDENTVNSVPIWNWYMETLFEDVKEGLMQVYNCSSEKAVDMIYHDGLKIYAAMDTDLQKIAEETFESENVFGNNKKLQSGFFAMDYSGRVLATIGSRGEKKANRLRSLATMAKRQPGSTMKPLAVYGPAIDMGKYNYSSLVSDSPVPNWYGDGSEGPKNWGPGNTSGRYWGKIPLELALERSLNASAAQVGTEITPQKSFDFLREKLDFTSLTPSDNNRAPMALGGLSEGVTVREMTAGFQIFGNGGKYNKPYTFYHADDHDGNVILDNRNNVPTQAISSSTASIMNHLLNRVVTGPHGTGRGANISSWEVYGKTGTTNDDKDSWFIGGTPYAVAGIWTGYLTPKHISTTTYASTTWKKVMSKYLSGKPKIKFSFDPDVVAASFCPKSGLLANPAGDAETQIGWYDKNKMPLTCDGIHMGVEHSTSSKLEEDDDNSKLNPDEDDEASHVSEGEQPETESKKDTGNSFPLNLPEIKNSFRDKTTRSAVPVG